MPTGGSVIDVTDQYLQSGVYDLGSLVHGTELLFADRNGLDYKLTVVRMIPAFATDKVYVELVLDGRPKGRVVSDQVVRTGQQNMIDGRMVYPRHVKVSMRP
ncbi:MAG: hypothetical protein ABIV43_00155 [Candidatus Saccharimonadales bacterium]